MSQVSIPIINKHFTDLNPLILGYEDCAPGHSYGPHIRDYYLIHYVKSGRGTLYNETGSHTVQAGEIFLILPGQETLYTADSSNPWEYIWVGFDGRHAEFLNHTETYTFPFPEDTFFRMLMAKDFTNTREDFLTGQLYIMFANLNISANIHPRYERQAADYISANYMQNIKIEDISRMMGLDRRYLGRIFKASIGVSMQEFLIQTRLGHAAQYLRNGETVLTSAALSGYRDAFNFSKMFKKRFGLSPQQYRKKHLHPSAPPLSE